MIAIYGAGQWGKVFSRVIKCDFFIDKYVDGELNGKPILKLDEIPENTTIYNSVATYENEVIQDLTNFNFISFLNTIKLFPEITKEFYKDNYLWLNGNLLNEQLGDVRKLLNDKISQNFFDKWVKFRESFDIDCYPTPTNILKEQYFIDEFKFSNRFVDCGGFDGDTIEKYYKHNSGQMISFEPDPKNLYKLQTKAKNKDVLIYPLGVYSETTILKFNSNGSGGKLDKNGDLSVCVTSLDETIYNFKPDYIKMDIEGSEKEALIGAKNILKNFSPNLAISIYHKASDLWEIPLLIKEINPKYEFKIRCHNYMCLETILYCKVKNKK